ncbi:hypothetical protein SAMN06297422_10598 [Lachnospiraceae bacterium]|nr:hypothetical protein SAMN06297422_10598 [Lachnospiraceae bacterium]
MAQNNKKSKQKRLLASIWILFILAIGLFGFMVYKQRDVVSEDLGFTTRFSYKTNANPDINALIITYLSAMASGDQDILKSCVTEPSKFDDMSVVQNQSKIITAYSNINCYTVQGIKKSDTIVYAVANISIVGIESTPLDMLGPFYIVDKNGEYLIYNGEISDSTQKYIDKAGKDKDIQELYQMVKKDEEEKAEKEPAFKEFLDRLND